MIYHETSISASMLLSISLSMYSCINVIVIDIVIDMIIDIVNVNVIINKNIKNIHGVYLDYGTGGHSTDGDCSERITGGGGGGRGEDHGMWW